MRRMAAHSLRSPKASYRYHKSEHAHQQGGRAAKAKENPGLQNETWATHGVRDDGTIRLPPQHHRILWASLVCLRKHHGLDKRVKWSGLGCYTPHQLLAHNIRKELFLPGVGESRRQRGNEHGTEEARVATGQELIVCIPLVIRPCRVGHAR